MQVIHWSFFSSFISHETYTVTPAFKVQLEDVLNRKHLPPLGGGFLSFFLSFFILFTSIGRSKGLRRMAAICGAVPRKPVRPLIYSSEIYILISVVATSSCGSKNTRQNITNGPCSPSLVDRARPLPRIPTASLGPSPQPLHPWPFSTPAPNKRSSLPIAHPHTNSTSPPTSSPHSTRPTLALHILIHRYLRKSPWRYRKCSRTAWIVWLLPLIQM